ncbi:class I SAM-dependent methyltransferase [Modestobacter muralis]|uniref:Class I SAM-dependent methyltransferase n=1 Tax=Modestobacter muralis TaxID=1608614 RepID=A0A6P0H1M5_9ACTN|nr:methyltransferase domain-containing protein [Modestobacter muralis]NEK92821.1 class I SAM-dependent methyltransferase [Modestobacter muralis]NEN49588.1 class I SAM-dependent methyltransferase [Modestobacter muralis]
MAADFAGETARLYARFRRDLPADQAAELAGQLGLTTDDLLLDLGCGTGQLTAPLLPHCAGVVAVDPEPGMLAGLRDRGLPGVVPVLGADTDLPQLGRWLPPPGALVVGNGLHWMDEAATLAEGAALLRPGGGLAVVTQGPPLWLGTAPWQQAVRSVVEQALGPVTATCGSDATALADRVGLLEALGLTVQVSSWRADHVVDAAWVVGHLGSALPGDALASGSLQQALETELDRQAGPLVEQVLTTAVVARRT